MDQKEILSAFENIPCASVQGNAITIRPNKSGCKLRINRRGDGYITNYTVSVGSAEARRAGFLADDGTSKELEKVIDEEAHTITFKLKC